MWRCLVFAWAIAWAEHRQSKMPNAMWLTSVIQGGITVLNKFLVSK